MTFNRMQEEQNIDDSGVSAAWDHYNRTTQDQSLWC